MDRCARCRARAEALAALVDEVAAGTVSAADAVFSPERLADQRARIWHRLERLGHPGRVIAFPRAPRAAAVRRERTRRWIGVAAAAGVVVGLVAGLAVDFLSNGPARPTGQVEPVGHLVVEVPEPAPPPDAGALDDELFLRELEAAALAPHVEALQAIDALTPHVREVRVSLVR